MKRAIAIIIISLVGIMLWARIPDLTFRGEDDFTRHALSASKPLTYQCPTDSPSIQMLEFGVEPRQSKLADWLVTFTSATDTLIVAVAGDPYGAYSPEDQFTTTYTISRNGRKISETEVRAEKGYDRLADFVRVVVTADDVVVYGGRGAVNSLTRLPASGYYQTAEITSRRDANLVRACRMFKPTTPTPRRIFETIDEMEAIVNSADDENVCFWTFYDEDYDDEIALLAGKYRLFLLPDNLGGYYILYVEGLTRQSVWLTGMVKGHLTPTTIPGSYNLTWHDFDGILIDQNISATLENGLLTIDFPYEKARFRFIRER